MWYRSLLVSRGERRGLPNRGGAQQSARRRSIGGRPNSDLDEVEPKLATDADADISRKYVQKPRGAGFWARLRDPIPGFQVIIDFFYSIEKWDGPSPPPRLSRSQKPHSRSSPGLSLTQSAPCAARAPNTPRDVRFSSSIPAAAQAPVAVVVALVVVVTLLFHV